MYDLKYKDLFLNLKATGCQPFKTMAARSGGKIVITIYLKKPAPDFIVNNLKNYCKSEVITGNVPAPFITVI